MKWAEDLWSLGANCVQASLQFAKKNLVGLNLIAIVCVSAFVFYIFQDVFQNRFQLLTGPKGGVGPTSANLILNHAKHGSLEGNTTGLFLEETSTQGYEENRSRIAEDTTGHLFGFAHDGFGNSSNVRVLLPLDDSYLHIVCRRKFLHQACNGSSCDPDSPIFDRNDEGDLFVSSRKDTKSKLTPKPEEGALCRKLSRVSLETIIDWADAINHRPKVSLGPTQSGTRQLSEIVMEHFHQVADRDYIKHDVNDWLELRNGLRLGHIDIGFYLGPLGSHVIKEIESDETAVLVHLQHVEAIVARHTQISYTEFPPHLYGYRPCPSFRNKTGANKTGANEAGANEASSDILPPFCAGLSMLKTRKVLICSTAMPTSDAYALATLTRNALSSQVPQLRWTDADTDVVKRRLSYALHPGAVLLRDNTTPGWFNTFWEKYWLALFPFALFGIGLMSRQVNERIFGKPNDDAERNELELANNVAQVGDTVSSPKDFHTLLHELSDLESVIYKLPEKITVKEHERWKKHIEELDQEIETQIAAKVISEKEYDVLTTGIGLIKDGIKETAPASPKTKKKGVKQ